MKRKIISALCTLLLLAVVVAIPAMAAQSESKSSKSLEVMHLTPENNPADPEQIKEINEDVKNGNVRNAIKSTDEVQILGQVYAFSFKVVSYAGLKSKNFSINENDVEISSGAHESNGDGGTGDYTITLYRDGKLFDDELGTVTYKYTKNSDLYSYTWDGVGSGNYYFIMESPNTLIDGSGKVYQQR